MRRFQVAVLLVALLALALMPGLGNAVVSSGCSDESFFGSDTCNFTPIGVGYYVAGHANSMTYIEVAIKDPAGRKLAGCQGHQFCLASFEPVAQPITVVSDFIPVGVLTCEVTTSPPVFVSYYYCQSYVT